MESAIWGLIGTVVGALTSIGTTWLSSQSSYKLQNARASDERIERASAFQRDTLLDLQEAIHDALRLSARAHLEDLEAHKTAGVWGDRPLTEEVNEGIRLANRRVAILVERVSDDSLRAAVKDLIGLATQGIFARSEQAAELTQQHLISETTRVLEMLGSVLRRHYQLRVE